MKPADFVRVFFTDCKAHGAMLKWASSCFRKKCAVLIGLILICNEALRSQLTMIAGGSLLADVRGFAGCFFAY